VHSRQNPLTPEANFKMTATIAEYHAKALDDIGSLYYSKENFDDFYYGKGSTYPDVHGTVGILFEQGSARGHLQATRYGELSFPFAIRNHLTTSLSTIEAAQNNQAGLKAMQRQFHLETEQLAKDDRLRAVVLGSHDPYRLDQLATILRFHQIEFYPLAKSVTVKSQRFTPGQSIIVPLRQSQYRLIKAMFETRTQFKDKVFYDVSAWNLAMAMDLNYAFISRSDFSHDLFAKKTTPSQPAAISEQALALAFDWNDFNSARLLSEMQQFGLRVQTVTKPTQLTTQSGVTELSLGSLILPLNNQPEARAEIIKWLTPKLSQLAIPPKEIHSGLAINGVDMGSPSIPVLKPVKPLLLIGDDFSSYATGEIWHLLDQRLKQPVTMMTAKQVAKLGSLDYTHLILAGGKPKLEDELVEKIAAWVKQGGVIIAHSGSAKWLLEQGWTSSEVKAFDKPIDTQIAYSEKDQTDAEHHIGGAIVGATIDTSHPLGFGLDNTYLPVFKRDRTVFTEAKEAFVSIARFHDKPLASGYVSKANQSHIAGETSILVQRMGKGRLVAFSDNPVFRGYWLGTAKVFTNALYFSPIVEAPEKTKPDNKEKDKTDSQESS